MSQMLADLQLKSCLSHDKLSIAQADNSASWLCVEIQLILSYSNCKTSKSKLIVSINKVVKSSCNIIIPFTLQYKQTAFYWHHFDLSSFLLVKWPWCYSLWLVCWALVLWINTTSSLTQCAHCTCLKWLKAAPGSIELDHLRSHSTWKGLIWVRSCTTGPLCVGLLTV